MLLLRRMKTDPTTVPDLPEKTEMRVDCGLSKRQAALYQKAVKELADKLKKLRRSDDGNSIQRRGIVLSTMMRLKQICNHPSQMLGEAEFDAGESGKFQQLAEVCEPIRERQEKALVFTQFHSICPPLADHLERAFGRQGLVLHGRTAVGIRKIWSNDFKRMPFAFGVIVGVVSSRMGHRYPLKKTAHLAIHFKD